MATWDDYYWYGGPHKTKGLKTCPFDSNHKIKPNKYLSHVRKCEQMFPNAQNRRPDSGLTSLYSPSFEAELNSLTDSIRRMTASDNSSANTEVHSPHSGDCAVNRASMSSADSAIALTDCIEGEVHTTISDSAQGSQLALNEQQIDGQPDNDGLVSNQVIVGPSDSLAVIIAPQQTTEGNTSVDTDDGWNNGTEPPFSLYTGYEDFDNLSDEYILEMADSFVDTVVISKMTKQQRKRLNKRLVELRKSEIERKKQAFNRVVNLKDLFDPQIKDIPKEIRKPRIDIRELFNFNKKHNYRLDTIQSKTDLNPEPTVSPSKVWSHETLSPEKQINASLECAQSVAQTSSETIETEQTAQESGGQTLNSCCNNCWKSLKLTEENIKRMTIFCAECSGTKFGGYFECQSCQLYGYFANSEISRHMSEHYSDN